MARIVLEFTGNSYSLSTGLIDITLLGQINWDNTLPTYSNALGSVRIGAAAPGLVWSGIFSSVGRYTESRYPTSVTNNFDITFNGFGFESDPIVSNSVVDFTRSEFYTPIIAGTVTSIDVNIENRYSVNSSPTGPYGSSSNLKMTITEIAISPVDLDLRNYRNLFDRVTTGDDQIFGSLANDTIDAGTGNDAVYANDGNDTVYGGDGNDFLNGENGNDQLFGGDGNDTLDGGAGNDFLVGGAGNDKLIGGEGDDGFVYDSEDSAGNVIGGNGYDTLFVNVNISGDTIRSEVIMFFPVNGIEQVIFERTDDQNLSWATIRTIYDGRFFKFGTEFTQDDGSRSYWRLDPYNTQSWSEIRDYYTPSGQLDYEQIFYDDGSRTFLDFDLANTASWSSRTLKTNAAGAIISDTYVMDAALAQRSSEIGSIMVAVKAIPVESII